MLEQSPVHEDVGAANPLHQVEAAGLLEKAREIPWCLPAHGEHGSQDIMLDHVQSAKPKEDDREHGNEEASGCI